MPANHYARSDTKLASSSRVAIGGRWRRAVLLLIALAAAGPSLQWAFGGAVFMHDDWWLASSFAHGDIPYRWDQLWLRATVAPARPGGALYYLVSYGLFGTRPVFHALLQGVINGALSVMVFVVAERIWRTGVAVWIAAVYAALPNRGSTRLWFAVANYPLALLVMLFGVLLLLRGKPRLAGIVLGLAVITFEGMVGLATLALAVWVLADPRRRWRDGVISFVPTALSAGVLFALSPKRNGHLGVGGFDRLVASQFGAGVFQWPLLAEIISVALLVWLCAVVTVGDERSRWFGRVTAAGLVILAAGWAPFFMTNWPIATEGFFDRANGVVGLGTAVVLGGFLAWLVATLPRTAGAAVAAAIVTGLLAGNASDVRAFQDAARDGDTLLAQVLVDVAPTSDVIRVVPPPDTFSGVAQYPSGGNLSDAFAAARGDRVRFWLIPQAEGAPLPPDAKCYDRIARRMTPCPPEGRATG